MALDVQPLSRTRQTLMVLVLLGLFAASLGFAQLLVTRHTARVGAVPVFTVPVGLTDPVPLNVLAQGATAAYQGRIAGQARRMVCFSIVAHDVTAADEKSWLPYALDVFARTTGDEEDVDRPIKRLPNGLAGRPAWELMEAFGEPPEIVFAVVRVTGLEGRIVAICFTGAGPYTDADREYLDTYCAQGVAIQVRVPAHGK